MAIPGIDYCHPVFTRALMKKGLRLTLPYDFVIQICFHTCPDEEGITTPAINDHDRGVEFSHVP